MAINTSHQQIWHQTVTWRQWNLLRNALFNEMGVDAYALAVGEESYKIYSTTKLKASEFINTNFFIKGFLAALRAH